MTASGKTRRTSVTRSLKEVNGFDLYYQLVYMSATASAGIKRNQIFALASRLPRPSACYFRKIDLLAQKLGYNYARACSLLGEAVKSQSMRSLLLRLSDALVSGQPEMDFLREEAEVQAVVYEKEYERDLTSLTKWTDAYGAIIVSTALIIIVNLVSTMIYNLGLGIIIGLVVLTIFTALGGTWVLTRSAPREVKDIFSQEGPWSQKWALRLAKITVPVIMLATGLMIVGGLPLGWLLIADAVLLLPLGISSMLGGREIAAKDKEIGPFLRSLGATAVSTGTTLTEAMNRLDLVSFAALQPDLERLRYRLRASIDPDLCWQKFALETGSKLISETVRIFNDAVNLGGDADTVGLLAAKFANRTIMLRAKRNVVTSTFTSLTLVIHGAIAALMVLIMEVMTKFVEMIWSAAVMEGEEALETMILPLPSLDDPQMRFLQYVTTAMVLLLAVANAVALGATDVGHKLRISFYLSLLLFISGLAFIIAPPLINAIMQI